MNIVYEDQALIKGSTKQKNTYIGTQLPLNVFNLEGIAPFSL
jgi:hypothetical protein